jgi:hypothetical protein
MITANILRKSCTSYHLLLEISRDVIYKGIWMVKCMYNLASSVLQPFELIKLGYVPKIETWPIRDPWNEEKHSKDE